MSDPKKALVISARWHIKVECVCPHCNEVVDVNYANGYQQRYLQPHESGPRPYLADVKYRDGQRRLYFLPDESAPRPDVGRDNAKVACPECTNVFEFSW